jgi:DNA-binding response OmpR family regulator
MMPDMDGCETCKRLKRIHALTQIAIMFVTTLSETDKQLYGLELGAVDYVTKPYVASLFRSRVRTHVSLYRHRMQLERVALAGVCAGIAPKTGFFYREFG